MSYHLFVDSTNCSAFRKYSCRFLKIACFLSTFERYNDLGICLWNPKQHRISEKSSNVADSATNLILACCGFHLQFADSTYICGFHLQDSTYIQMSYHLFVDSTNCSAFRKYSCRFLKIACFLINCGFHLTSCGFRNSSICGIQNSIEYQKKVAIKSDFVLLRIPLTIHSTYSCGFRNSSI